jgi:hypothetical protein
LPDYLSIGSNADFFRIPMSPMTGTKIANLLNCSLPTKKIVDDIYKNAEVKLEPKPMTEKREAVETFLKHNQIIEEQRQGETLGKLVAGIKKDIVITNKLLEKPDKVAIYGWHKLDGNPIQPVYTGHIGRYVDYSHGIRLVYNVVTVDGKKMQLADILKDPTLCDLLSDEGVIDTTQPLYPTEIKAK